MPSPKRRRSAQKDTSPPGAAQPRRTSRKAPEPTAGVAQSVEQGAAAEPGNPAKAPKVAGSSPAARAPDWERIEIDYRAGVKSLREIATEHGVSHVAVKKRADKAGWTRDLSAKVKAKADALVTKALVTAEVNAETKITEAVTIEVESQVQARIRLTHRADIARNRVLVMKLLSELEQHTDNHGTFEQLLDALAAGDDEDEDKAKERRKRLWEQWQKAMSLGPRVDTAKKLAETLRILIDKEREAFGIGPAAGEDGEPTGALAKFVQQLHSANAGALPMVPPKGRPA